MLIYISILFMFIPKIDLSRFKYSYPLLFCLLSFWILVGITGQVAGDPEYFIFAYFCVLTTQDFICLFIPNIKITSTINACIYLLLLTINTIVTTLRWNMFLPADFFSAGIALHIFPNYISKIKISYRLLSPVISFIKRSQ